MIFSRTTTFAAALTVLTLGSSSPAWSQSSPDEEARRSAEMALEACLFFRGGDIAKHRTNHATLKQADPSARPPVPAGCEGIYERELDRRAAQPD